MQIEMQGGNLQIYISILVFLDSQQFHEAVPWNLSSEKENSSSKSIDTYLCQSFNKTPTSGRVSLASNLSLQNRFTLSCLVDNLIYKTTTDGAFLDGIRTNGELEITSLHMKLQPGTFCVQNYKSPVVTILTCEGLPVIKKCCASTQKLRKSVDKDDPEDVQCVDVPPEKKWSLAKFRSTSDEFRDHHDLEDASNVSIAYGKPHCHGSYKFLDNSKDIWFMILSSGWVEVGLRFWFKPVWLPVQKNEYCVDELEIDPTSSEDENSSHEQLHKNQILLYCQIENFDGYLFHRKLFGGMCLSAAGCVLLLLLIYLALWDKQNLSGWTQFNIFVALFFVLLIEGLRTWTEANGLLVSSTRTCILVAAIAQFFFFALNTTWSVMSFDLFYMFWKLENLKKNFDQYKTKLMYYLAFSWGVPCLFVCIAFYLTHQNATSEMDELRGVYAFAHRRCSSPIRSLGFQTQGILFMLNLFFFLITTFLIWKHRRDLSAARMRTSNYQSTWRSVRLFLKLVILMGIASLSIPVDYFFVSSAPLSGTAVCFRIIHFIPILASLFIFGINKRNIIFLREKYPRIMRVIPCYPKDNANPPVNHSRPRSMCAPDHHSTPI